MSQSTTSVSLRHEQRRASSMFERTRLLVSSGLAAVLGLAPHVLHHVGPLAGAALFAGVGGSLLFGALGLVAALPFLVRVHRRSGGWRRPLAFLALFAAVFSISTFVVGPALSGEDGSDAPAEPSRQPVPEHQEHH